MSFVAGVTPLEDLEPVEQRFEIVAGAAKLGAGSTSDVLLAIDRASQRQVAVKVMSVSQEGTCMDNIRHEVEAMMRIQHPNIVRLIDVLFAEKPPLGVASPSPHLCLVTEHVTGGKPLSALIRCRGPQPLLAAGLLPQLSGALGKMHERGLVHRDIWSENVMVDHEGLAVLVDLGCAADFEHGPDAGTRLNVPYMSPEAYVGGRQHPGDDCWSLGCLLTEVIGGGFLSEELGRSDVPLHAAPDTLVALIRRSASIGGATLGQVVASLLDLNPHHRLAMSTLVTFGAEKLVADIPERPRRFTTTPTIFPNCNRRHSASAGNAVEPLDKSKPITSHSEQNLDGSPASLTSTPASLSSTAASSADIPRQRCAQVACGTMVSPPILLSAGGSVRIVPPDLQRSASRGTPQGAARRLDANLISSLSGTSPAPAATPTAGGVRQFATSPMQVTASATQASGACPQVTGSTPQSVVQTPVMTPSPTPRVGTPAILQPGMRIMYVARSHGAAYQAVILGRDHIRNAWRVHVPCSGEKLVPDAEIWRLQPMPSSDKL